jgi:hypothetical protein
MDDEMVSVIDIANELGKRKQSIFKVLNRLNIERNFEKSEASRGQRIAYITLEDYRRVKAYYVDASSNAEVPITLVDSDTGGLFYLIQSEPRCDPGRFKLGFATNIEERLRSHRTSAPFSELLKTWPCKLLWEKTAIECASQTCERIHTEVFRTESIGEIVSRLDQFFALMPEIDAK